MMVNRMRDHRTLRTMMRACWPKEQHVSQGAAEAHLRSLVRRGLHRNDRIHTYCCGNCHLWHVGHNGYNE